MITPTTDGAAVLADRIRTRARDGYQLDANETEVVTWALGLVLDRMPRAAEPEAWRVVCDQDDVRFWRKTRREEAQGCAEVFGAVCEPLYAAPQPIALASGATAREDDTPDWASDVEAEIAAHSSPMTRRSSERDEAADCMLFAAVLAALSAAALAWHAFAHPERPIAILPVAIMLLNALAFTFVFIWIRDRRK